MLSIILSRQDWRENDQLISFYTLEKGKVEVLARGVKKVLSKNSAYLEPFCFVEAEIIQARDLARLGAVTQQNIFKNIRMDLNKSLAAGYLVLLINKLFQPHEPDKNIFNLLKSWLEFLNTQSVFQTIYLDAVIIRIMSLLGFDILSEENMFVGGKRFFEKLIHGSWGDIEKMELNDSWRKKIHSLVYRFVLYHSEVKLADWGKLAN